MGTNDFTGIILSFIDGIMGIYTVYDKKVWKSSLNNAYI